MSEELRVRYGADEHFKVSPAYKPRSWNRDAPVHPRLEVRYASGCRRWIEAGEHHLIVSASLEPEPRIGPVHCAWCARDFFPNVVV